ncbi:MAG: stage II sporulation protein M [Gammaproteobacteria bacterium]|nr:stage II sporulation protein M [Gammaproteobacteria bacterium]
MTRDPTLRQRGLRAQLVARAPLWQQAQARTQRFEHGRTDDAADAVRLADDYRLLAHDLARARSLLPESRTREYLENTYARTHATLHDGAWHWRSALRSLFATQIPASVRFLRPYLQWTVALFVLAAWSGYVLIHRYPDLIALVASPDLIASVEQGKLWTEGLLNIVPSSVLSVTIFANNISVSLAAFCAGLVFGLGTLYILGLNGFMLGAIFAFVSAHGLGADLLSFILAHGPVELSVMCLSGAAGAALGEALIRPDGGGRIASFRAAAEHSGPALLACALLLIGAGLIEGYVSPSPRIGILPRLVVGLGYFAFMLALLSGRLTARLRP